MNYSYKKQVEIILAVTVEAEIPLTEVTAESVGEAIVKTLTDNVQVSMPTLDAFSVSLKRIHTESNQPWSLASARLAVARSAIKRAFDAINS